jgi:hypothetical protein
VIFKIRKHPALDCDVVEVHDEHGRLIAAIIPQTESDIQIVSECIVSRSSVTIDDGPINPQLVRDASATIGVSGDDVLALREARGSDWPVGVNIKFDLSKLWALDS